MVKMEQGKTLKRYISYLKSQMTLVYNCNDDVIIVAFITGLQAYHSFYKHLVKHVITNMKDNYLQHKSICSWKKQQGMQQTAPPSMKLRLHTRLRT